MKLLVPTFINSFVYKVSYQPMQCSSKSKQSLEVQEVSRTLGKA